MLLIQRIQMTVNSGLHFNPISGGEKRETGASLEGHISRWGHQVTEVRSRHLVQARIWCLDSSGLECSCLGAAGGGVITFLVSMTVYIFVLTAPSFPPE